MALEAPGLVGCAGEPIVEHGKMSGGFGRRGHDYAYIDNSPPDIGCPLLYCIHLPPPPPHPTPYLLAILLVADLLDDDETYRTALNRLSVQVMWLS